MESGKAIVSFNAVVETEIKQCKEVELCEDELYELLVLGAFDKKNRVVELDEVNEINSQQLNEMLLGLIPDELKNNCVSMIFTDIKVTLLD